MMLFGEPTGAEVVEIAGQPYNKGIFPYVDVYLVDENAKTYELVWEAAVPYSSIVSNGSQCGDQGNWVVNSGVAMVFGEYDADGELIREYAYECTMQNYRTFKYEMNIWFR